MQFAMQHHSNPILLKNKQIMTSKFHDFRPSKKQHNRNAADNPFSGMTTFQTNSCTCTLGVMLKNSSIEHTGSFEKNKTNNNHCSIASPSLLHHAIFLRSFGMLI